MRIISLVPSWTELLIECGMPVVGRTRFCIHPKDQVQDIAIVGGTKDLDWEKVKSLKADLLIIDQEENLPWMKSESPIPVLVTHVTSVQDMPLALKQIENAIHVVDADQDVLQISSVRERWEKILSYKKTWSWPQIPAEIKTLRRDFNDYERLVYVIWKKPWMSVREDTFIGSVLSALGAQEKLAFRKPGDEAMSRAHGREAFSEKKYPEFEISAFDLQKTYFLFSSEPFPFLKKESELLELGVQGSIVDGESYSWFGLRALVFLEKNLK